MIPAGLKVHTAQVQTYLGAGSLGDQWAPAVPVVGFFDGTQTLVLDDKGEQAVSTGTFFADRPELPIFAVGSLVMVPGVMLGKSRVVVVGILDDGGVTGLDHLEVKLGPVA